MKKLRTRLSLHFLIQFIVLFITTFLIFISLLLLIVNFMTKEELENNEQKAIVENIPINIFILNEDDISLADKWVTILKENDTWMQVINRDGKEVFARNNPDSLQKNYSVNELLQIEETGKHGRFTVDTYFEIVANDPYYFLFGYVHNEERVVREWHDSYSVEGMVNETGMAAIKRNLEKIDGKLEVYNGDQLIQEVGMDIDANHHKLDVISRLHAPGKQSTSAAVFMDEKYDTTWVYYPNGNKREASDSGLFLSRELQFIVISLTISLAIAIAFSIWNGYRYGKPLLLFINWFGVMKDERYGDILSKREQKKIYRKSGKLKLGYRLYKEVIESFSNMAHKLEEAELERRQLEDTREDWMVGISHDLRTPITSMHGYGHLLESNKYEFTVDELQEIGKVIREKSDYMVDLVEDFSLIFKLKNSTLAIDKLIIDLNEFSETVLKKFQNDLTLVDYTFTFVPSDVACYASIDPKWFVRALDNLLYNAVKHNPPHTTVTMSVKKEDEQVSIAISDDGVGMDGAFLNKLFSRYYRGINTEEQAEGEGLGMSITKAIVELHGGDIQVQSEKDVGTTIMIVLKAEST